MSSAPLSTTSSALGTVVILAVFGCAVFGVSLLFAPTGDDWSRAAFEDRTLAGYLDQAIGSYQRHNGRVLGNSLSFILIEPLWLRAAAKAVVVVALVAVMQVVVGGRSAWTALLCFAGVFLVPAGVFRESYVWSAGFFNYVPPMIGLMHLVAVVGRRWSATRPRRPWLAGAGCAAVGFATCLFIEHVTVAALGIALAGLAIQWVLRQWSAQVVGWATGALAGSAVLFGSPGLDDVIANQDAYFSYAASVQQLVVLVQVNYSTVTGSFVFSNAVLLALITASCVGTGWRGKGGAGTRSVADWFFVAGTLAVGGYAVLSRVVAADSLPCGPEGCDGILLAADLSAMVVLLTVLVVAGHRYLPRVDRGIWFLLLTATVLMIGPLLVVAPIGPRNIFGPTVTVVTLGVLLSVRAMARLGVGTLRMVRAGIATVVVVGLAGQVVVHSANFSTARERVLIMMAAVDNRERSVELPVFPYRDWVHDNRDTKMGDKYYIDEPRDIKITVP
jgi:hypothetical protein